MNESIVDDAVDAPSPYVLDASESTAEVYGGDVTRALLFTTLMRPGQHIVRTAVAWTRVGSGGELHHHTDTDEYYYVLDGVADVLIEGTRHRLGRDSFVRVPRGSTHSMSNGGAVELRYLAFHVADLEFTGDVEHVTAR